MDKRGDGQGISFGKDKMTEQIIIAGSGGQGIMAMARILANAAMLEDKFVTWLPCYGAEVRGGSAYCMVKISDREIASPYINLADTVVALNKPSLDRFIKRVKPRGTLFVNTSLVDKKPKKSDCKIIGEDFSDIASDIGNVQCTNMVALGALVKSSSIVGRDSLEKSLREAFKDENVFLLNEKAIKYAMKLVKVRKRKS